MVLLEHVGAPPQVSQADLGLILGIDKSNIARLCGRMEAAGHVSQERASDDGRSRLVSLTGTGKRLAQRIEHASRDRFSRIVAALPQHERSMVFESLAALNLAIETLRAEGERP
jgi:DNA-binding MarR family transcriptional regulator